MIVKCIATAPNKEQTKVLGDYYRAEKQGFGLEFAKEYVVFVLKVLGGQPWVEIVDSDLYPRYLFGVPLCLFELVDKRVSAHWELGFAKNGELKFAPHSLLGRYYHDDLFEGVAGIVEGFKRVREDLETEANRGSARRRTLQE